MPTHAQINAGALGSAAANFGLLSLAASIFLADVCLGCGLPTLVYMFKTAGGDLLAGKLDQKEWWAAAAGLAILPLLLPTLQALLGAAGAAAAAAPLAQLYSTPAADGGFGRILLLLFGIQLACELGDARLERWTFFRHRYSFEVSWGGGWGSGCVRGVSLLKAVLFVNSTASRLRPFGGAGGWVGQWRLRKSRSVVALHPFLCINMWECVHAIYQLMLQSSPKPLPSWPALSSGGHRAAAGSSAAVPARAAGGPNRPGGVHGLSSGRLCGASSCLTRHHSRHLRRAVQVTGAAEAWEGRDVVVGLWVALLANTSLLLDLPRCLPMYPTWPAPRVYLF